jgi:hypothetical protein
MVIGAKLAKSGEEVYRVSRKEISVDTVERAINLEPMNSVCTPIS